MTAPFFNSDLTNMDLDREEVDSGLASLMVNNVEGLKAGESLGSGSYGAVYKVTVNGIPRIAKRLLNILLTPDIDPDETQGIRDRFSKECLLLSKLDHPNVVQFVGVNRDEDPRNLSLIMESLHVDLEKFLKIEREIPLSVKLSILLDVSSGLVYLHTQLEKPLVHRDLKPSNVLLTNDLRAKIADLGVSKLVQNYPKCQMVHTKCPGTMAYMPPEVLSETPECSPSLDIFSFGQLTLYVANQLFPEVYDVSSSDMINELHSAIDRGELQLLKRRKWIEMLEKQNHCLLDMVQQCLQDKPRKRPTAKDINQSLKTLCVIHPKSLEDVATVWGGDMKVSGTCTYPGSS